MSTMVALRIEALSKTFRSTPVLEALSFSAEAGLVTAVLGRNGAGKSTCFKIVMGLLRADAGTVEVCGRAIDALPVHRRAEAGLGYLPQDSAPLAGLTVSENLLAIIELTATPRRQRAGRCDELLDRVGLGALAGREARVLSGGERRRLEIAKALAGEPRVLLLDEPFAALDPRIVEDLGALVRSIAGHGVAVVVTDHNVVSTLAVADRVHLIEAGQVLVSGTPTEIKASSAARAAYLGSLG